MTKLEEIKLELQHQPAFDPCEGCGKSADYYWIEFTVVHHVPADIPHFYCEDCLRELYGKTQGYLSFEDYLKDQNIKEP